MRSAAESDLIHRFAKRHAGRATHRDDLAKCADDERATAIGRRRPPCRLSRQSARHGDRHDERELSPKVEWHVVAHARGGTGVGEKVDQFWRPISWNAIEFAQDDLRSNVRLRRSTTPGAIRNRLTGRESADDRRPRHAPRLQAHGDIDAVEQRHDRGSTLRGDHEIWSNFGPSE